MEDYYKPKQYKIMAYRIGDNKIRVSMGPEANCECLKMIVMEFCDFYPTDMDSSDRSAGAVYRVLSGYNPDEIIEYLMTFNRRDETTGYHKVSCTLSSGRKVDHWVKNEE